MTESGAARLRATGLTVCLVCGQGYTDLTEIPDRDKHLKRKICRITFRPCGHEVWHYVQTSTTAE